MRKQTRMRLPVWAKKYKWLFTTEAEFLSRTGLAETGEITKDKRKDSLVCEYKGRKSITSEQEAIDFFNIDMTRYQVDRLVTNAWDVTIKDKSGEGRVYTNYQVKLYLRPVVVSRESILDWLNKRLGDIRRPWKPIKIERKDLVASINIFDAHLDKRTLGDESLDEKIAVFEQSFDRLLSHVAGKVDTIYFPIGNDLFNTNAYYKTANGTDQQNNAGESKAYEKVLDALERCIDKAAHVALVKVPVILGNHDKDKIHHAGDALKRLYRKCEGVEVDSSYQKLKIYQEGKVLLSYVHGDRLKINNASALIASKSPDGWATSKYRELNMGHEHHEKAKELPGLHCRWLKGATKNDQWEDDMGYDSVPGCEASIYSRAGYLTQRYFEPLAE